ncbi:MAG TPA: RIP metalloprotease, partial [Deinococcales bacterium]|nr:RIP metalloprotease [Deinococcales bacterium]
SVMIHELAHYLNARSVGIPVRAFSIGFGPVIWKKTWRGTEWRLSLIPLGGYVDLPGLGPKVAEDGTLQPADEGMALATLPQKVWVLIGGVIANMLLGIALITGVIMLEPDYRVLTGSLPVQAAVAEVNAGSPAARLGFEEGDRIVSLGGVADPTAARVVEIVSGDTDEVEDNGGILEAELLRGSETVQLAFPWPDPDGNSTLGIGLADVARDAPAPGFGGALAEAARFSVTAIPEMVGGFVRGFGSALSGRQSEDIAGPVGIVSAVNQATKLGVAPVLFLMALINLSLAVFNLLPIPGLDGGRILLAVIVGIRGKPFAPGQEETIHFFGIMAVLLLIVLITVGDVGKLFGG